MRFLKQFERHLQAIDVKVNDFNHVVFACLESIAREWWDLLSSEHEYINSFRDEFVRKYWTENECFQISAEHAVWKTYSS